MDWKTQRQLIRVAAEDVAAMVAGIQDFSVAGLGTWDLGGLVGHFIRAITTPVDYLQKAVPDGEPLADAATYVAGYLRWRAADPGTADAAVAARGVEQLSATSQHPATLITAAIDRLDESLDQVDPARLVLTRFGALPLTDYLRTRSMEIVIHGLDIARAVHVAWNPPEELIGDVLALLGEVAIAGNRGNDLLLVLSGRINPTQAGVLPVLQ